MDTQGNFNPSSAILIPIMVSIITTGIIAIIGRIINHYRSKIPQLYYTESINYITSPVGGLEVRFNNHPIPFTDRLFFILITLVNESKIDVQNIICSVIAKPNTKLLNVDAYKNDLEHPILRTEEFELMLASYDEYKNQLDIRRDFQINVLNRGDKIRFYMLVTCQNDPKPNAYIDFDHVGVNLRKLGDEHVLHTISFRFSLIMGIILSIISTTLIALFIPNRYIAVILTGLSCIGCIYWGGGLILRFIRWVIKIFFL